MTILPTVVSVVESIIDLVDPHPDLAVKLAKEALGFLSNLASRESEPPLEEMRSIASGMAAARSSAVGEALRRHPTVTP
jgi:hypothetical protein